MQHPESPARKPPVPLLEGCWDDGRREDLFDDRSIIPLLSYPSKSNRELEVLQILEAHVDSILEATSQEEEGRRVFWKTRQCDAT